MLDVDMNEQVRQAIRASGLTLYRIAHTSGITASALTRFMAGERDMSLRTLQRIAPLIGVSLTVKRTRRKGK